MPYLDFWHYRYLEMCELVASWSKDPSSKFGSVIVDDSNRVVSLGFNGFPSGFKDSQERWNDREFKYAHVIHSEVNALLHAKQDVRGCTLYCNGLPCSSCMGN